MALQVDYTLCIKTYHEFPSSRYKFLHRSLRIPGHTFCLSIFQLLSLYGIVLWPWRNCSLSLRHNLILLLSKDCDRLFFCPPPACRSQGLRKSNTEHNFSTIYHNSIILSSFLQKTQIALLSLTHIPSFAIFVLLGAVLTIFAK